MRRIKITWAKPGDILGYPIFRKDGAILLNSGVKLTENYIQQLKDLGITHIYIQDEISQDIIIPDPISIETKMEALRVIADNFYRSCRGLKLDVESVRNVVNSIVDEILSSEQILLNLHDIKSFDNYVFSHSLSVTVISIIVGRRLGYNDRFLRDLGIGCMLHDIGKLDIPKEILDKPESLTPEEYEIVKFHTHYGYRRLRDQNGDLPATSAHVAWEHHERYDGSGYPRSLRGEKIHIFSRIASVSDVYDAMTTDRVYRKAYSPSDAMEFIMGGSGTLFDYNIVGAFVKSIAPYPVGDIVLLSTGETAIVIDVNRDFPLRPIVRVLKDDGWEDVDLMKKTDISVLKSLEE
ncbi:MAG: HD-GYP domain-containing protein [bacterium]|nr:HD-GYP domain-containing protein [bacterium]